MSPIQGLGRMWQKTDRMPLRGADVTPAQVIAAWKEHFPEFWPKGNSFFAPLVGIAPGEVAALDLAMPGGLKLSTGVLVLDAVSVQTVCVDRRRQWARASNTRAERGDTLRDLHDRRPNPPDVPAVPPRGLTGLPDAVVVGAGPNGLAAAVELARAGRSVLVLERSERVGGGTGTAELTLPGYRHDVCSAIHPLALGSPFLRGLPLAEHGLRFVEPTVQAAHPLTGGRAVAVHRSVERTAAGLGVDAGAYTGLIGPLASGWEALAPAVLGAPRPPRHPVVAARFAVAGLRSAEGLARSRFRTEEASALLGGMAAHSMLPLGRRPTAAFALVLLSLAHATGWPVARGGSQAIADAMAAHLRSLGGEIETGRDVRSLDDVPPSAAVLLDVAPRRLVEICGDELPAGYRAALRRYRLGAGVFKVDYALSGPVPWLAAECRQAGTVHLGGTLEEVAASEAAVARGGHPDRPYVLVAQQSLVDPARAPAGHHTLWAYCHVPNGSAVDMSAAIERQIERFAPGFGDLVLARAVRGPADLERENPNCVGGDINGGMADLRQLLARPVLRLTPYATPNPRIFLCSAATPPGGGVHGMCGYHAARAALRGALR